LHKGLSEDRDLVRHVLRRLPEAEQIRIVRILLLDDHRDVLECLRELRRQHVKGAAHVLLKGHRRRGASGGRTWNALIARKPKAKPPTCAAKATPPPWSACVIEKFDCQSWKTN